MLPIKDLFLNGAKDFMKPLGVWIPSENESIMIKIYRIFIISLQYIFLMLQFVYLFQVWGDIDAMTQAAYLVSTQGSSVFKLTVFHFNMDIVKEMLNIMDEDIMQPKNSVQERILILQATRIKRILLPLAIGSQLCTTLFAVRPLFDGTERTFGFDLWMPVDPKKPIQFCIGTAFQLVTISISALIYLSVDSVTFCIVLCGCAQLDIVKEKILNITPVFNKRGNNVEEILSKNYEKLVDCVKHHQTIVRLTNLLENAFHSYLLFQLSGTVGIICMSALKMMDLDWRSVQYSSIVVFLTVMIVNLFVCCWCGHELTAKSEQLPTAMYECIWYEQNVKFKRALCIAMICMGRPLMLRAGHYIQLSRPTFVSILRMSYSYFAVLSQTKTRN